MDTENVVAPVCGAAGIDGVSLSALIVEYKAARENAEIFKDRADSLKSQIIARMNDAMVSSYRVKDGPMAYVKPDLRARINKDDEAEAFAWLRDNGHGGLIKQKEEVHHGTLTAWARERMEAGEALPPSIKVSTFDTLCVER